MASAISCQGLSQVNKFKGVFNAARPHPFPQSRSRLILQVVVL